MVSCKEFFLTQYSILLRVVKAIKIRLFSKRNIPKIKHGKDS